MILFGSIGIALALVVFFVMLIYMRAIYGLVVSLMGTLAGVHAVLGYIGRGKITEKDTKKVVNIGTIFAFIASVLPYILIVTLSDVVDVVFIAIGTYGGYLGAYYVLAQRFESQLPAKEISPEKKYPITFQQRITLIFHKMMPVLIKNVIWLIPLLLITLVLKQVGIVWFLVLAFFVYDLYKYKVFSITAEDVENLNDKN